MEKKLRCPKCNRVQNADVLRCRGRVVAALFQECGHSFEFKKEGKLISEY